VTCREFAEFIADFLDGSLPAAERAAFEGHLARCGNCGRYLDGYRQSMALGKQAFSAPGNPVPADVPEDLVEAIARARRAARGSRA
jgi:anti-sigma factor RsiW